VSRRDDREPEVLGINRRNLDLVFADYRPGRFGELDDKVRSKVRLEGAGVAVPATIGVVKRPGDVARLEEWLADHDEFVVKPSRGWGGRGILVLERASDALWRTPGGRELDDQAIHDHVLEILTGVFSLDESEDCALIEQRIRPDAFLHDLYPRGMSDLRVVVEDGEPVQAMLRVPTDASDGKANLHGGGLGLGIDLASGRIVHAVQQGRTVTSHPDTGLELVGRSVPRWAECLEVARAAAAAVAPIRYVGVDIVIDAARGPLVLEINARPGLAIQIANRAGQPVRRRHRESTFERVTGWVGWILFALLALGPLSFQLLELETTAEVRSVRTEQWRAAEDDVAADDRGTAEWADQATPVSERSETFARARLAAAARETLQALRLYREASEDPSLTPFALNNLALIQRSRGDLQTAATTLGRAVAAFPDYARGHYNLGLIRRDLGQTGVAEACFLRALEIRPSHANSWSELGELLLNRGVLDSAKVVLERAVRYDPDDVGDRRRLARVHRLLGQPGAAATRYAQALALDRDSEAAAVGWVDARLDHAAARAEVPGLTALDSLRAALAPHLGSGASLAARGLAAELDWWAGEPLAALEAMRAIDPAAKNIRWLAKRAVLALELGLWDEVEICLRASDSTRLGRLAGAGALVDPATSAAPPGADAVLAVAWSLAQGRAAGERAASGLESSAAIDRVEQAFLELAAVATGTDLAAVGRERWSALRIPTPIRVREAKGGEVVPVPGSVLLWAAGTPEAIATLDAAFPDFRPRLRERFQTLLAAGEAPAARDIGLRLLRTGAEDDEVLAALVDLELTDGDAEAARAFFDRLDDDARGRPDVQRLEARLRLAEGDRRGARRQLASLASDSPLDAGLLSLLATAQAADGRHDAARSSWERALRLQPDDARIREQLARSLMELRRYAEAVEHWQRLVALDLPPDDARSALFNLALALQRDDRDAAAIVHWDDLLAAAPELRSATYNRALALERLGRLEEAIAGYRRVLELDPDHEPSLRRLQRLRPEDRP
jgi:alpha-L-glutamate ligase-like protein